jgi:low temperature requirement protein LtrA
LLRGRTSGDQQVRPFELFFDLVFVFAVTQLAHRLLDHLTVGGAAETLLLLLVVWQAWVTTTWVTNWFDPDQLPVRLMLVGVMLASLFMSAAIPDALGDRGLLFAAAVAAIHVGRAAFAFVALRTSLGGPDPLTRTFQRALCWHVAAGAGWMVGGLLDGWGRYLAWGLALAMNYGAPLIGYYLPGLGSSRTAEWVVQGHHFAERCRLFIIIALGESLLVNGATFGEGKASAATTAAFVVAFAATVALWWIYFQHSAEAASQVLTGAADPGRLARSAYTYLHLPMVAGIIAIAAADELTVGHPGDHGTAASVALALGGPALFLAGHALFKRAVFEELPWPHLIAIAVLAVMVPVGLLSPALVLGAAVALTLVGLDIPRAVVVKLWLAGCGGPRLAARRSGCGGAGSRGGDRRGGCRGPAGPGGGWRPWPGAGRSRPERLVSAPAR